MMNLKIGKQLGRLSCALLAGTAFAADFTKDGGGDLASAADWGGTLPPSTEAVMLKASGTYRLSADTTFNSAWCYASPMLFDFAQDGDKKLTLDNPGSASLRGYCANGIATFSGGKLNLTGSMMVSHVQNGMTMVFSNKCELTTSGKQLTVGNSGSRNTLRIVDGAQASFGRVDISAGEASDNRIVVAGGATMNVSGTFYGETGTSGTNPGRDVLQVMGTGTTFNMLSTWMQWSAPNGLLEVADGATFNYEGADDETMAIVRGTANAGNRMVVRDGAKAVCPHLYSEGIGTEILVSNATLSVARLTLGKVAGATGTVFRLTGQQASFSLNGGYELIGPGGRSTFSVEDGASWTNSAGINLDQLSGCNTFRIAGAGSTVCGVAGKSLAVGAANCPNCTNNVIQVVDGGLLEEDQVQITGQDNMIIVSNATVSTRSASNGLMLGYTFSGETTKSPTNNVLVLQGATPLVTNKGSIWLVSGTKVRWELPPEGYAKGFSPIVCESIWAGQHPLAQGLKFEIAGVDFFKWTGGRQTLLRSRGKLSDEFKETVLGQDWSALPNDTHVEVTDYEIVLRCPRRNALMLFLR